MSLSAPGQAAYLCVPACRRTVESESEAELASAASNANLSDIEEDSVYADELGLVFFDGKRLCHYKCCATLWQYATALGNLSAAVICSPLSIQTKITSLHHSVAWL